MENRTIDLNELGRYGYNLLRKSKVVPDKEKLDLSFEERDKILNTLNKLISDLIIKKDENKDKTNFLVFLYSSIKCYIDNTDLNKFISLNIKNSE